MIKYTKIAMFFESTLSDSEKMFWAHYANPGELSAERLRSCWLGREGVPVETKGGMGWFLLILNRLKDEVLFN